MKHEVGGRGEYVWEPDWVGQQPGIKVVAPDGKPVEDRGRRKRVVRRMGHEVGGRGEYVWAEPVELELDGKPVEDVGILEWKGGRWVRRRLPRRRTVRRMGVTLRGLGLGPARLRVAREKGELGECYRGAARKLWRMAADLEG